MIRFNFYLPFYDGIEQMHYLYFMFSIISVICEIWKYEYIFPLKCIKFHMQEDTSREVDFGIKTSFEPFFLYFQCMFW